MSKQQERVARVKHELATFIEENPTSAIVGRVRTWLKDENPDAIYPFSCTTYEVGDSMEEGKNSIEHSWLYTSYVLRKGAGVAVNLNQLRPKGHDNGKGLIASGPTHFIKVYSAINDAVRRGGVYKNGAVVVYINISHPDLVEFLQLSPSEIPWAKRAIYVSDDPNDPDYLMTSPHLQEILYAMRAGTVWLAKKQYDQNGDRLFSNVCLEILLKHSATCILSHVNLGYCTVRNIRKSFRDTMRFLCKLHSITNAGRGKYYIPLKEDRQVGLGVLGLANILARYKVSYKEFTDCLENALDELAKPDQIQHHIWRDLRNTHKTNAVALVREIYLGFQDAAVVAKRNKMERAFTVAPTATCSFNHKDLNGYTTTPEISPPICHLETKKVIRASDTFGQVEYQYPPNVETASEVGWDTYYKLAKNWQRLMETTGLAHSISFNIWDTCPLTNEFLEDWLHSPLKTTYYRMQVSQDFLDKTNITVGISDSGFESDGFIEEDESANEDYDLNVFLNSLRQSSSESEEETDPTMCSISAMQNGEFCSACAE